MNTRKKHSTFEEKNFTVDLILRIRKLISIKRSGFLIPVLLLFFFSQSNAQNLDVPYVPTPNDVLERMLDMADVGPGDYVIDLGSGDGRIVIAAAKRGAVGHGIDLDPERIAEARENAETEDVSERIMFMQGDIFETDFSQASVITLYLLTSVNLELRPSLLENLEPGTRVVSHSFDMGEWRPDESVEISNRDLYFWIIPADVDGSWNWNINGENFSMNAEQEFQELSVELNSGNRSLITEEATLKGKRINLIVLDKENNTRYIYSGVVENNTVSGTVQVHTEDAQSIEEWSATLSD